MDVFRFLLRLITLALTASLCSTLQAASEETSSIFRGEAQYNTSCSFCHGLDAGGGTRGPDLVRSELVNADNNEQTFITLLKDGRPDKGMPASPLPENQMLDILFYIQEQIRLAANNEGGRRSVTPEDLATGNAENGQMYFEQNCSSCHDSTRDLAGIAERLTGLPLIRRMLYPGSEGFGASAARPAVTIMTPEGEQIIGELAYQDEFTIALRNESGQYMSWQVSELEVTISDPLSVHVEQLDRYTDEDIHDVYAFLLTLKGE